MNAAKFGVIALLVTGLGHASTRIPCVPLDFCPLPADLSSPALFQARVDLEFRRAGGARPAILKELLATGEKFPSWGNNVVTACQRGQLDCNDYVDAAQARAKSGPAQSLMLAQLVQIRIAAALQRLGRSERRKVYERALAQRAVTIADATLYGAEAVQWITWERMVELNPLVRRIVSSWDRPHQEMVEPYALVLDALASPDPSTSLTSLVRQAASEAAKSRDARDTEGGAGGATVSNRSAFLALDQLRRLNADAEMDSLKAIIALSRSSEVPRRQQSNAKAEEASDNRRERMLESLGALGIGISGVIGDLGDREFEREALGGRTQWDQVREAEQKLVAQGRLQALQTTSH